MAFWAPYVPVAERRARARREMNRLRKKGKNVQPIAIEGRTIARSFWGKGWCDHLESFSDFANRLPRGRTYVRNGSVCHLEIRPGRIDAIVSGSELYDVSIEIQKLKTATWQSIKTQCAGQIGSVLELLQGKLSTEVMRVVTKRESGLFPKPREIELDCSCPDWATMCKHVAAVLYGVGSRLDTQPELLFLLRDVDAADLIATELALPDDEVTSDRLADDELSDIFGIDLDTEDSVPPAARTSRENKVPTRHPARQRAVSAPKRQRVPTVKKPAGRTATAGKVSRPTLRPTGKSVARLRRRHGLSVAEFAAALGVSATTVYRWELTPGRLKLQHRPLQALMVLHQQAKQ